MNEFAVKIIPKITTITRKFSSKERNGSFQNNQDFPTFVKMNTESKKKNKTCRDEHGNIVP